MKKLSKQAFKDKRVLSEIQRNCTKNKNIQTVVVECLPEEVKTFVSQSLLSHNTLVIIVANQVLASKIRFHLPMLKSRLKLHTDFSLLRKIKLQISANTSSTAGKKYDLEKPVYSTNSSQLLADLSKTIDNPELQQSLNKLASHVRSGVVAR